MGDVPEQELPAGWEARTSRTHGDTYYVNLITNDTIYDWPTEPAIDLPEGWTVKDPPPFVTERSCALTRVPGLSGCKQLQHR